MAGFISALLKMRKEAKKAAPDTNGRLKEILDVLKKYNYDDGITPEIVADILQDLGPTFVKIGPIASQQVHPPGLLRCSHEAALEGGAHGSGYRPRSNREVSGEAGERALRFF